MEKKAQAAWDLLESAEKSVAAAKRLLAEISGGALKARRPDLDTSALHSYSSGDEKVVEGVFTGDAMLGVDKRIYPVPANYASKSHIVQGTKMKARIEPDGKITYKIIEEMPFETRAGILVKDRDRWQVACGDKVFNVLMASVTYLRGNVGDQVSVRVPAGKEATYACLEAVLPGKAAPAAAVAPSKPARAEKPEESEEEEAPKAKKAAKPAKLEIEESERPAKPAAKKAPKPAAKKKS